MSEQTHISNQDLEKIIRIFNTALVKTRLEVDRNYVSEMQSLMQSPAFLAILTSIQKYATDFGVPLQDAAEEVVNTFRKLDRLWNDYIFQEGMDHIGKH